MIRQVQHRKKRRARGLCVREGCGEQTDDTTRCERHAADHRRYVTAFRERRRALRQVVAP